MPGIPRWTADPGPARVDRAEVPVPGRLAAALGRVAREVGVPSPALLLAAHARVVATLTGGSDVTVGRLAAGARAPEAVRVAVGDGSWRELAAAAAAAPGAGPADFETVLDLRDAPGADLPAGVVLAIGMTRSRRLAVHHRTDAADAEHAARVAGYHLAALRHLADAPDEAHDARSLLSPEELRLQAHRLAGPGRALPGRRAHELFEERARRQPDAVAATHRGERATLAELNRRANRVARALLAAGLRREDPVAVVSERDLGWMAAVLAVLKAGGAYLPVEPDFPPERVAAMVGRAGCRLALTGAGARAPVPASLPIASAAAGAHPDADLGLRVEADQLAYLYFTSGSTGEPKGAMCEHAGLVNHLLAKIEDLGIGPGDVVAQTAPQCFDISLWQLLAGPLAGGSTLIVEQEAVMDADRFLGTAAAGGVTVLQVVPSYLEVLVSRLERRPRPLPALRCVSATGEALRRPLVERWFAVRPGVRLVNAYGLTETSDDTNHEVMERVPAGERVPIGRPVRNVRVAVVDERLRPVPLGSAGELVFSGVCVGRGYVNDEERTRLAFLPDPDRPGGRRYRSGDIGRWLPGGSLEFLGRRDAQVKVRGFRIEIGEVESHLARLPGVRDCAVVVAGDAGDRRLTAFCAGAGAPEGEPARALLRETLPEYMVPSRVHRLGALPVTDNGKVDRRGLAELAVRLESGGSADPGDARAPSTPAERRVAAAWAEALGVAPELVGPEDHFFDRGGTSLAAIKLAVLLDRRVAPEDVASHPTVAGLAALVASREGVVTHGRPRVDAPPGPS